jgi:hypothetical protein
MKGDDIMDNEIETMITEQLEIENKFENFIKTSLESRKVLRDILIKYWNLKIEMRGGGKTNKEIAELKNSVDEKIKDILENQKMHDDKILKITKMNFETSDKFYQTIEALINIMKKEDEINE